MRSVSWNGDSDHNVKMACRQMERHENNRERAPIFWRMTARSFVEIMSSRSGWSEKRTNFVSRDDKCTFRHCCKVQRQVKAQSHSRTQQAMFLLMSDSHSPAVIIQ